MKRRIIEIDEAKCNGCGACAAACHEGAIGIIGGKAKLLRDDYCDGLGDCLPTCPTAAISFIEREAAEYDEKAVLAAKKEKLNESNPAHNGCSGSELAHNSCHGNEPIIHTGCPGSKARRIIHNQASSEASREPLREVTSQLAQWPCQIKLVPANASFLSGAKLLIAADCTAYAYANIHSDFMHDRVTIIGCPKLDAIDYSEKLTDIIKNNDIKSVTILRMEVPCCGGIELAAKKALQASGKFLPWRVVTITTDGKIKDDK